jgi:hypothetical protein
MARLAVALAASIALMVPAGSRGQMAFPREPEEDNREYVLDAATNE